MDDEGRWEGSRRRVPYDLLSMPLEAEDAAGRGVRGVLVVVMGVRSPSSSMSMYRPIVLPSSSYRPIVDAAQRAVTESRRRADAERLTYTRAYVFA